MRLFVAVDLPAVAVQAIARVQQEIAASFESVRLVRPEQLHITLAFLGDVSDAQVPGVVDTMGAAVGMTPFDLVFSGIGVFPPRGAPRACWIGIAGGVNALVALRKTLADRIEAVGIPLDARPYSPHLTLGRWREPRRSTRTQSPGDRPKDEHVEPRTSDRMKMMALSTGAQVARMCVERATLYQSRLSAAGSTYTALAHANLTAGSAVG